MQYVPFLKRRAKQKLVDIASVTFPASNNIKDRTIFHNYFSMLSDCVDLQPSCWKPGKFSHGFFLTCHHEKRSFFVCRKRAEKLEYVSSLAFKPFTILKMTFFQGNQDGINWSKTEAYTYTLVLKKPLFQKRVMAPFIGDVLGLMNDSHVRKERHASLLKHQRVEYPIVQASNQCEKFVKASF